VVRKPLKPQIKNLIDASGVRDRREAARLLLDAESEFSALQFTGLAYFFLAHISVDMRRLESEIVDELQRFAENEDFDVQALALAGLHFARGEDPPVRSFLADKLATLGARDSEVRSRWEAILDFRGQIYALNREFKDALTTYRKTLEILPDDPRVLRNVGIAYANLGDHRDAIQYLERSLAIEAAQPAALVNLGHSLSEQGDFEEALASYRRAIELNPTDPLWYQSLGNALMRRGAAGEAVLVYGRAVALDPSLAVGHFALGQAHAQLGEYDRAIDAINRGLEFDPDNESARQSLDAIRQLQQEQR
jgi:tetratricopeptide (TPR) repeat protein